MYSFFHSKTVELGFGAGLRLTDPGIGLKVTNPDEVPGAPQFDESGDLSTIVPLPALSSLIEYRITPKLAMRVRHEFFALEFEDISRQFSDQMLMFEYQFNRNFALGFGCNRVNLDVSGEDSDSTYSLNVNYDGFNFYVKGVF